jgi:uncharacterized protein YcbX
MAGSGPRASDTVQTMWRYPIKSMQGEAITSGAVTARGVAMS